MFESTWTWPNFMFGQLVMFVCWSLTSLCHSNGHIETIPAREINPFTALTRIRSQLLRTQWSTSNHSEWTQLRVRPLSHRGWRQLFMWIGANNGQIWLPIGYMSDSKQCSNRLDLYLISLLVNFSCELGPIMTRYDFLWASYGLDEWFWAMFEPTWIWPNFIFGQNWGK